MAFGTGEIVLIGFIIVAVLSASRMGAIGNALGKFVYSFRKASRGDDFIDVTPRSSAQSARLSKPSGTPEEAEVMDDPSD